MKYSVKRFLSLVLAMALVFTMLPASALAQTAGENQTMVYGRLKLPDMEPGYLVNSLHDPNVDPQDMFPAANTISAPEPLADTSQYLDIEGGAAVLRAGMVAHQDSVTVRVRSSNSNSSEVVLDVFYTALEHTGNPKEGDYLGWQWDGLSYSRSGSSSNGTYYYDLRYYVEYYTTLAQENEMERAFNNLMDTLDLYDAGDYYKVKGIYDWICANVTYDYDNLNDSSYGLKFTAYAALMDRTAVCQGYALLLYRMALTLGVDCRLIASVNHGYNIVKLGDRYYYLDSTWDAGLSPSRYNYFLQNPENFEDCQSHIRVDCSNYYGEDYDYTSSAFYARYPMSSTPFNLSSHSHDYRAVVTPPTCTEQGYTTHTCSICANTRRDSYTDPQGHDYVDGYCERCGAEDPDGVDRPIGGFCGDNATWNLDQETGLLTIAGTGDMYDFITGTAPWYAYREDVALVVVEGTVDSVGDYAFYGMGNLTSVTLEAGVESIGQWAMACCSDLESVTIPGSVTEMEENIFASCPLLAAAGPVGSGKEIEYGWTEAIPDHAVQNADNLTGVSFPSTLTEIGEYAFDGCTALAVANLPENLETIGNHAFSRTDLARAILPDTVTSLGVSAYEDCASLTQVSLSCTLETIGASAFASCIALEQVEIPASVESVGACAFYECDALTEVTFLGSAPTIGTDAFCYVTATVSYYADSTWTEDVMQQYGGNLTWVNLGEEEDEEEEEEAAELEWSFNAATATLTISGEGRMADYGLASGVTTAPWAAHRSAVKTLVIGEGVTEIGDYAFYGFAALNRMILPDSLLNLGNSAFEGCTDLPAVELPDGLASLGDRVFYNTPALRALTVPASVESIGEEALVSGGITRLTFLGNAPQLGEDALSNGVWDLTISYGAFAEGWADVIAANAYDAIQWFDYGAASGNVAAGRLTNRINWTLDGRGVLTITGRGAIPDVAAAVTASPWVEYRNEIVKVVIGEGITSIGDYAFYLSENLSEIQLPGTLTTIGAGAFEGAWSLVRVDIPDSVHTLEMAAFGSCPSLNHLDLGEGLVSLEDYAFISDCALTYVYLPASLEEYGVGALEGCTRLCSIALDPENEHFSTDSQGVLYDIEKITLYQMGGGYRGDYTTAETTCVIAGDAFKFCGLTGITLTDDVVDIGLGAFYGCVDLEELYLPDSVEHIGESAFRNCYGLTIVRLGDGVSVIDTYAFAFCENLTELTFGSAVQTIGCNAFDGCGNLSEVLLPNSVTSIGDYAFANCTAADKLILGSNVVTIGEYAFSYMEAVIEVMIPDSVTDLGSGAFNSCSSLEKILFLGDAPGMGEELFSAVSATAYYPGNNTTWTEDVRLDYGGSIRWVPYDTYELLEDSDTTFDRDVDGDTVVIHTQAELSRFVAAWVDGNELDSEDYVLTEGSTILTLTETYLNTLSLGRHVLVMEFTDGYLVAEILVTGGDHTHDYEAVVTDPTCIERGYTTYTCSCGDSYVDDYEDPLGHAYDGVVTEPGCVTEGYTTYTCLRCGDEYVDAYTDPVGHTYEDGECIHCGEEDPDYEPSEEFPVSGTCGEDLTWVLDEDGLLTISGTGDMYDYTSSNLAPWYTYRDHVRSVLVEGTADSIGDYAFYQLPNMSTVTIESGVSAIGGHSMKYCSSLVSVTIPGTVTEMGVSVFEQSPLLTTAGPASGDYAIKFGWTQTIPANAFMDHRHLERVVFPGGIRTIGEKAFLKCSGLTGVSLPRNLESLGSQAFEQTGLTSVALPGNLVTVGSEAFESCPLTSVTFGSSVTEIGYAAFRNCDSLTNVVLPESLQTLGGSAFENCTALGTVALNEGVVTIGGSAFYNCSAMVEVTIPSTVTSLGAYAFRECDALNKITFRGDAPQIGTNAFGNVVADAYYPGNNDTWTERVRGNYGGELTWISYGAVEGIIRLAGANRYDTAFAVADQLKENLGVEKFEAVVVAYGQNFPDALTGSYLAAVKNAPILLTESSASVQLKVGDYISRNLVAGGKVYILGGTAAVSFEFEIAMRGLGYQVVRLKGAGRYETNLAILEEAGVNTTDEVLIATGTNYADSLSASATGLPMLLVGDSLTPSQIAFLYGTSRKFVILGGTGAVSAEVEEELARIGSVVRVKGSSRYGTSVAIAERYFRNPEAAVLAYAQGFPDGLCGGPLAVSMGAPLILTSNEAWEIADEYVRDISTGAVTGGTSRISDDTVREIFDLPYDTPIPKK